MCNSREAKLKNKKRSFVKSNLTNQCLMFGTFQKTDYEIMLKLCQLISKSMSLGEKSQLTSLC